MKKSLKLIGGFVVLAVIAGTAYGLRSSEEASAPIEAIPVAIDDTPTAEPTAIPEETAPADETATPETATGLTGSAIFSIVQEESEVRFSIDEVLRGSPTTAVGASNQIAAEIVVDFDSPANSKLGTILINARTLTTDSSTRNRMINNQILDTGEFEFITFSPTSISGLPESIAIGDRITFLVTGDLTIRNFTNEETFEITLTLVSADHLVGFATTIVERADYELVIPSVPSVAEVSEEVLLEFDFVAVIK